MNTLRRVVIELVPTYSFDKKDIDITKNTSIYNNDYMRLRLHQIPVIGIENDSDTVNRSAELEYEANISTFERKIEDITIIEKKEQAEKLEKSQNFIMHVSAKNTTNEIMNVTTDNEYAKYYYKGKPIDSPYKQKLLLIKLKPREEFKCSMTSSLNIGLKHSNFSPTAVCVFIEADNDAKTKEYKINIESIKQLTEKEILIRACEIIDIKLNNFQEVLINKIKEYKSEVSVDNYNTENKSESIVDSAIRNSTDNALEEHRIKGIINIENESHTFGNLLSRFLQDHKSITFAGYKIDHLLIKELTIAYKTDGTDIVNIINDIIKEGKSVYKEIKENLKKLKV